MGKQCAITPMREQEFEELPMIITVMDVARAGRMHPRTVQKLARAGKLPAKKVGDKWRFNKTAIAALFGINKQEAGVNHD